MLKKLNFIFILMFIFINSVFSQSAISLFNNANQYYQKKDYQNTIYCLNEALKINPNYKEALIFLSKIYYNLEYYDYSYNYIKKAEAFSSNDPEILINSANIEYKLGRYKTAEEKYKKIIASDPFNTRAYNGLIDIYLNTNRKILAKKYLDKIIKSAPSDFNTINMFAEYYFDTDKKLSEEYYIKNTEQNSLNPDTFFYYSIFKFKTGDIKSAIDNLSIAIELDSENYKYNRYMGKYYLYNEEIEKALNLFKKIVLFDNANYLDYYNLAVAYSYASKNEYSNNSFKRTIHLNENDEFSQYYYNKFLIDNYGVDNEIRKKQGVTFFNKAVKSKNEYNIALYRSFLTEAIKIDQKNSNYRIKYADIFLSNNLPERYLRELILALKYDADNIDLKDKIEIESSRISYQLGDDWGVSQYKVLNDEFSLPIFYIPNIQNVHYDSEKIFSNILEKESGQNPLFSIVNYGKYENNNDINTICSNNKYPIYSILTINENSGSIQIEYKIINSISNEIIKTLHVSQTGNDKVTKAVIEVIDELNNLFPIKSKILKLNKTTGLINAGRRSGIKPGLKLIILYNKNYLIEINRAKYIYDKSDIKGTGYVTKVDENISEIKITQNGYVRNIDIDDLVIFE